MRKCLLIMAAFVAVLAASAVSGAGTAGASTTTIFCVGGYNTCFIYPYPANMTIHIWPDPYTSNPLSVTGSWTSATSAAAGTYTEAGNAEPVSDITLGAPEPAGNNQDQYTCLSFEINATSATVYADEAVNTSTWDLTASNCMGAETVAPPGCGSTAVGYQAAPTVTSPSNWAGYDAESSTACTFTGVTGQWVQPALACPGHDEGTLAAEFWVGLDGAGSATVEQTGTEALCVWDGSSYHTEYQAWYQMYPDPAVDFSNPDLGAGSLVKATVTYKNGEYSLNLTVTTKGRALPPLSTEQPCTSVCENMSAEWVVEKVQGLHLADFTIWHLTDGEATTAAKPGDQTVASFTPVRDTIDDKPYLRAGPAGLDGSSFFVLTIKQ